MADGPENFRTLSISDGESVPIRGGTMEWIPVRRWLGIGSFGVNAFRAVHKGEPLVEDHVESPGQEELYVLVKGRARLTVGEETLEIAAGTAVFVERPDLRRSGVALEDDTVVLAIGGWRSRTYHPLPWEAIYFAHEAIHRGDWADAVETLEREAGEHRDTAALQFRLACCHARLGEGDLALAELRRSIELDPGMRERAASSDDLASLRERDDWPAPTI